jgi:hypothetical protein
MKVISLGCLALIAAATFPVFAQMNPSPSDMHAFAKRVQADKKLVVAGALRLSDAEAKRFWAASPRAPSALTGSSAAHGMAAAWAWPLRRKIASRGRPGVLGQFQPVAYWSTDRLLLPGQPAKVVHRLRGLPSTHRTGRKDGAHG